MIDEYDYDEFYCACDGMDCEECEEDDDGDIEHCDMCKDMNYHDCNIAGCYGDNPNAHIEIFGTYAPGSEFDDYYNQ